MGREDDQYNSKINLSVHVKYTVLMLLFLFCFFCRDILVWKRLADMPFLWSVLQEFSSSKSRIAAH